MAAIYAVYTSPTHTPIPNHLPTLIVTPHGQPNNILYSYLHTNFNSENYLLTPSPQGDLCVAKLFPPRTGPNGKSSTSDPGHGSSSSSRVVRCEASRNLKWTIANTGVIAPIYKLSLPSPDSADLPLFQISKPNPNAGFWSMFYFAYAGHNIPPKRIEFGKIQKNPPGPNGGGTRISITGKSPEEKAVWQTLGEGNEDCVEWVVLCAALNLLDDEILKAAEKHAMSPTPSAAVPLAATPSSNGRPAPVSLRDPGPVAAPVPQQRSSGGPPPNNPQQRLPPPQGPPQPHPYPQQGPPPGGQGPPLRPPYPQQHSLPGPGPGQGFPHPQLQSQPQPRPGPPGPPGGAPRGNSLPHQYSGGPPQGFPQPGGYPGPHPQQHPHPQQMQPQMGQMPMPRPGGPPGPGMPSPQGPPPPNGYGGYPPPNGQARRF